MRFRAVKKQCKARERRGRNQYHRKRHETYLQDGIKLGLFWYLVKPLDDLNDLINKATEAIGPA